MSSRQFTMLGKTVLAAWLVLTCTIPSMAQNVQATRATPDRGNPTFNTDVAAIIHSKCSMCHRPGQVGPFSLLTFADVKDRAETIAAVIESGYMPPWKPVNHNVEFANDRRLTDEQVTTLKTWMKNGMPAGIGSTPQPPSFSDDWMLGKPDLVVTMNGKFTVPASGPDLYRSFVFPVNLPDDKWVKAIELKPSAKSSVHHGLFFIDSTLSSRVQDGLDGQAGIAGMGFLPTAPDDEHESADNRGGGILSRLRGAGTDKKPPASERRIQFASAFSRGLGGYVPGSIPTSLPGDLAMFLPKGSDVVMQTHFHPSGKPEVEQAQLAFYFADKTPAKQLVPIQVPALFGFGAGINIPAGEKNYRVEDTFITPIDLELISVGGHAHYICREMSMTAKLPDGREMDLMKIDDWDLDWQDRYLFGEPIQIPAGTVLTTKLVYDNSADNPENPHDPPQTIHWGRQSEDEMGSVSLQVVAKMESERPRLEESLNQFLVESLSKRFANGGLVDSLLQLDANRDGLLQQSEAPPRLAKAFRFLDQNGDGGLDRNELERIRKLVPGFNKN